MGSFNAAVIGPGVIRPKGSLREVQGPGVSRQGASDGRIRTHAVLAGLEGGRGAVRYLELEQQLGDVVADGLLRHPQATGDLVVATPDGEELENLALAGSQVGEDCRPRYG